MPRTKRPSAYVPPSKRVTSSRGPPLKRTSNDQLVQRRKNIAARTVYPEKGLNMMTFRQTFIPDVISVLGWLQVARQSLPYNEAIVREFYASLAKHKFVESGEVEIHGTEVTMTPERINQFYELPSEPNFRNGLPPLDEVHFNAELASALRINGSTLWGTNQEIKQAELHFPVAFWNIFSLHSVQPTRHTSDVNMRRGRAVYCLMTSQWFDLGRVIHNEITEASACTAFNGILPFPGLITHFYSNAGIVLDPSQNRPPATPIGVRTYNGVVSKRPGLRKLKNNGDFKDNDEAEEAECGGDGDEEEAQTGAENMFGDANMFDLPPDFQTLQSPSQRHAFGPWEQKGLSTSVQYPPMQSDIIQQILQGQQTLLEMQNCPATTLQAMSEQQLHFQAAVQSKLDTLESKIAKRATVAELE